MAGATSSRRRGCLRDLCPSPIRVVLSAAHRHLFFGRAGGRHPGRAFNGVLLGLLGNLLKGLFVFSRRGSGRFPGWASSRLSCFRGCSYATACDGLRCCFRPPTCGSCGCDVRPLRGVPKLHDFTTATPQMGWSRSSAGTRCKVPLNHVLGLRALIWQVGHHHSQGRPTTLL